MGAMGATEAAVAMEAAVPQASLLGKQGAAESQLTLCSCALDVSGHHEFLAWLLKLR